MFTERELLTAIDACQTELPNTYTTCEKLAVFYTVLDHLQQAKGSYMMSADPEEETVIGDYGTSDFFSAVSGKDAGKVWQIIGELADALKVLNPKLYSRTIERINAID